MVESSDEVRVSIGAVSRSIALSSNSVSTSVACPVLSLETSSTGVSSACVVPTAPTANPTTIKHTAIYAIFFIFVFIKIIKFSYQNIGKSNRRQIFFFVCLDILWIICGKVKDSLICKKSLEILSYKQLTLKSPACRVGPAFLLPTKNPPSRMGGKNRTWRAGPRAMRNPGLLNTLLGVEKIITQTKTAPSLSRRAVLRLRGAFILFASSYYNIRA